LRIPSLGTRNHPKCEVNRNRIRTVTFSERSSPGRVFEWLDHDLISLPQNWTTIGSVARSLHIG
jgi:hypothetical protein